MLGVGLAGVFTGLVHVVTTSVSLYMQLFCCVWKTMFPYSHLLPLAFVVFVLPPMQLTLRTGKKECDIDVLFGDEPSNNLSFSEP